MIFSNFNLVVERNQQIIELKHNDVVIDLHNATEFNGFNYDVAQRKFTLFWTYYKNDTERRRFKIDFTEVHCCEVSPRDAEMPTDEDDCLEQIKVDSTISFLFMGGMKITINAKEAKLTYLDDGL